jgi:pyruvate formate lyase activating enzyme
LDAAVKKGIVFDVKKFAVDDGPGIRTTVFLKGCPMRCWWCHNPEGQASKPELTYRSTRCNGCLGCIRICPERAISHDGEGVTIDREKCNLCERCCQKCPTEALTITGKTVCVDEILAEIEKDMVFYDESGGGVTVSGGEPLFQPGFLNLLLTECKERNVHTAVDTCGYAPKKSIDMISSKVDLFLYDIKMMDERRHKDYTGVSNKLILRNLRGLAENGSSILVRFPIIPEVNDDEENVTQTGQFLASCGVTDISLLPYHRAGIDKYTRLGRACKLENTQPPSRQRLRQIGKKLEAAGLNVKTEGE